MEFENKDLTEEQFKALIAIYSRDIKIVEEDAQKFSKIVMKSFEEAKELCGAPKSTDKINEAYKFKDEKREIEIKFEKSEFSRTSVIKYSGKKDGKGYIYGNIYSYGEIESAALDSEDACMPVAIANTIDGFTNVIYPDKLSNMKQSSRGESDISSGSFSTIGNDLMRGYGIEYNFEDKQVKIYVRVIGTNELDKFSISTSENVGNKKEEAEFINRFIDKFARQRSKSEDKAHSFKQTNAITNNLLQKTETKIR